MVMHKGRKIVPFYVYEVASIKHREERNWDDEQKAKSALKHVARRALTAGAKNEDLLVMSLKTSGKTVFEATISDTLKPAP
jgi:hypothetical protein